ncbi:MAG: hypothetical protein ACLFPL_00850 [Candidatus Nanoarchaeia archaeon]
MNNTLKILYTVLGLIIVVSIGLVVLSSSGDIEKEYSILLDPSISVEELSDLQFQGLNMLSIQYTNTNSLFPKRVEVEEIYGCVFHSQHDTLLISKNLNANSYQYSTSSDVFNLNTRFVDISANSTVNVIYSGYINKRDVEQINESLGNFYLEFKVPTQNEGRMRYIREEDVCTGNVDSRTLEI